MSHEQSFSESISWTAFFHLDTNFVSYDDIVVRSDSSPVVSYEKIERCKVRWEGGTSHHRGPANCEQKAHWLAVSLTFYHQPFNSSLLPRPTLQRIHWDLLAIWGNYMPYTLWFFLFKILFTLFFCQSQFSMWSKQISFKLHPTPSFTTENLKASRSIKLVMFFQAIVFSNYKQTKICAS